MCFCSFTNITLLCAHLRNHEAAGEMVYPVRCCQRGCSSTFTTVWSVSRHICKFHSDDVDLTPASGSLPPSTTPVEDTQGCGKMRNAEYRCGMGIGLGLELG